MKYKLRIFRLWMQWKLASLHAFVLKILDMLYEPGEPLPSVLRAELFATVRGERYATAVQQAARANKLRARQKAVSAELDVRSAAVKASTPSRPHRHQHAHG